MGEYIEREALLKSLDMAMECKDCPRNADKELYKCVHNPTSELCSCSDIAQICGTITDFATYADVQPANRWISVDEKLPPIGESVLVAVVINAKVNLPFHVESAPEICIGWRDNLSSAHKWCLQFANADTSEV